MSYYDVYFETDPVHKMGYSIFVKAFSECDALDEIRRHKLCYDVSDINCGRIVITEISEADFIAAQGEDINGNTTDNASDPNNTKGCNEQSNCSQNVEDAP